MKPGGGIKIVSVASHQQAPNSRDTWELKAYLGVENREESVNIHILTEQLSGEREKYGYHSALP